MKVVKRTTVSVDLPCEVVISRLMEMQGSCRERDTTGNKTEFFCFKNGKFYTGAPRGSRDTRWNFVDGRAVPNGSKTDVHIRCCIASSPVWRWVILVLDILLLVVYNVLTFGSEDTSQNIIVSLVLIAFGIGVFFIEGKEIENSPADLETMENNILHKLDAVKRWDE